MQRSTERILTTHTGSLPRPPALAEMLDKRDKGTLGEHEAAGFPDQVREAVAGVVRAQREAGVDIVNDGEMSKMAYSTYVRERLSGYEGDDEALQIGDMADYPDYAMRLMGTLDFRSPTCTGPVAYVDHDAVRQDIANLKAATDEAEAFMSAASPGVIALFLVNRHYPSHEDYLAALVAAMKEEYDAIHEAGLLLQLDCPDLAMGAHIHFSGDEVAKDFRSHCRLHVDAINEATRDIPADRLRVHLCWGNYEGPHHLDIPLADIADIIMGLRAEALLFEAANPRHEHEWRVFEQIDVPEDKVLIPGVIDSTTNYIEHPELVADRLERFARIVGREQVQAGTDCGFATVATYNIVDPQIAWAKLRAMSEGAQIASDRLWS